MKITDIRTIALKIPLKEGNPISAYPNRRRVHIIVEVSTDEGIKGYGESIPFTYGTVSGYIEQQLKPLLVGMDPTQIERIWDKAYKVSFGHGTRGISLYALSAVEVALWDILGKYRRLPVYEMIGGLCKPKVKAYASLMEYAKPEEVGEISVQWAEQGYKAVKIHQGKKDAIESTKAVRDAVGDDIEVMLDVNGAWSPRESLKAVRKLEKYDLTWLEEPIWPVDDYASLAWLRSKTDIFIAGGENEHTHHGFRNIVQSGAYDIIQPDVIMTGGISTCRKIFGMAEAWNLGVATHSFFFGPGVPAAVQLSLSNVSSEWVEINAVPLEDFFIKPAYRPVDGYVSAPAKPGLGFEIDWDVVEKYQVNEKPTGSLYY
jgi:L-alanine-DL-glutamate epimerase-like enolase superfamily enzyme